MAIPPLSDDLARAAAKAYKDHPNSERAAAKSLGVPRGTYKHRLSVAAERGMLPTKPVMPGFEIKTTSAQLDAGGNVEKEWIRQHKESGPAFTMPPGQIYKGLSVLTDSDGRARLTWHKTRTDTAVPDLVAALETVFKRYRGRAKMVPAPRQAITDLLTVYPIADQHNGLLSWGRETGEDYDMRIGAKRLRDSMAEVVAQSRPSAQAIILNLGDWYHADDQRNMTPRGGNLLDVDSRYFKILSAGVQLMIDAVDLALQKHRRVIVRNIPGNHDPHAALALTLALKMFYARDKRVVIDDDPGEFYFYRFGAVLLGAHHGHRAKADRLANTMANVCAEAWGKSRFRYFYTGHIHHETAKEIGGVRVESFQTLAAKDAYAVGHSYLAGQSLTAITLHRRAGEIGRHRVNIIPPASRPAVA